MEKKENKFKLSWVNDKKFGLLINFFITCVIFVILLGMINLTITAVQSWVNPPPTPTDLSFMLLPYLGLPFFFWFCVGIGLMFGLTFYGVRLINFDSDSHNNTSVNKVESSQ